jgi:hypothetical protein
VVPARLNSAALILLAAAALAGENPFFSLEVTKPVDVMDHFPLAVGNRWVYERTYRTQIGSSKEIAMVAWTSEIEVVAHHEVPEGRLIERRQTVRDLRYDIPDDVPEDGRDWIRENLPETDVEHYLIRGNYVYGVPPWAWDSGRRAPTDWRPGWVAGPEDMPDFFFPMSVGLRWAERVRETADLESTRLFEQGKGGAPNPGMYYRVVEGRETIRVPYGTVADAWRLVLRTLPDHTRVWFKDGIGEVKETYSHHGTLIEGESVLKEFHGVARPSRSAAP